MVLITSDGFFSLHPTAAHFATYGSKKGKMYVYGKNLHVLVRFVFLFMYESYGIFIKCQGYFYEIFCEISISSRIVILLGGCREIYQIPLTTLCEERYRVGLYWSVFRHQDRDDEVIILKITMTTLMTITMTMAMVMVMVMAMVMVMVMAMVMVP